MNTKTTSKNLANFQNTHLDDSDWRSVSCGGAAKDESIPFHMQVTQSIRHHEHRRRVSFPRGTLLGRAGSTIGSPTGNEVQFIPKLDFSEESFSMTTLMSPCISSIVPVLLCNDGVSTGRQDKEIRDHCCSKCGRKIDPS
jgi:hypothetical protein